MIDFSPLAGKYILVVRKVCVVSCYAFWAVIDKKIGSGWL